MDDFANYTGKENVDWTKEAQKTASRYNGRSELDLVRDIYARAVEGKKNGTLTNEQIDLFYNQFSPLLDNAKRKKLKKIIEQLKSI